MLRCRIMLEQGAQHPLRLRSVAAMRCAKRLFAPRPVGWTALSADELKTLYCKEQAKGVCYGR